MNADVKRHTSPPRENLRLCDPSLPRPVSEPQESPPNCSAANTIDLLELGASTGNDDVYACSWMRASKNGHTLLSEPRRARAISGPHEGAYPTYRALNPIGFDQLRL